MDGQTTDGQNRPLDCKARMIGAGRLYRLNPPHCESLLCHVAASRTHAVLWLTNYRHCSQRTQTRYMQGADAAYVSRSTCSSCRPPTEERWITGIVHLMWVCSGVELS